MILYLSSNENVDLLDYLIQDKKLVIKKLSGQFNLNKFVIHDMRNLSHCTQIVIDLKAITDKEEELLNGITAFKAIYNARIVIIAEGLENNSELLKKLIDIEIFNLITADKIEFLRDEIEKCLIGDGMSYQDCLKFLDNITDNYKSKSYNFTGENIIIVVAGVMPRVGTTTVAMNLSNYLASIGAKVCYVEYNMSEHLRTIAMFYDGLADKGNYCEFKGVRYYNYQRIDQSYNFIVYDLGVLTNKNIKFFNDSNIHILCSGSKPYELRSMYRIGNEILDIDVNVVLNYISSRGKEKVEKLLNELEKRYYYLENSTDLFNSMINRDVYNEIIKEYIEL
jgi:hypothetical protein